MILTILKRLASLVCFGAFSAAVCAQGTLQFGFEQFPVGATPPFVTRSLENESAPMVADAASALRIQPFEGQKYLAAHGLISLKSPNGQLIQSYSLRFWAGGFYPPYVYTVGGQRINVQQGGWQT